MKWLKLFERFDKSDYYVEINRDEYFKIIYNKSKHENWSNLDKEQIKNFKIKGQLPNIENPFMYSWLFDNENVVDTRTEIGKKFKAECYFTLNKENQITAYKTKDEWIYCEWTITKKYKSHFFKCDQIVGFEQLLNDINEKIPD